MKLLVWPKELGKCYVVIFTCATTRAVHLEMTKTQKAEEFRTKLNAFIARRTRPKLIISDNARTFKATASWIKEAIEQEPAQINRKAAENEPRSRRHPAVKAEQKIQQLAEDEELNF